MKVYIFFSVHEEVFHRVALRLRDHGVTSFTGFVWSTWQAKVLAGRGIDYQPLLTFTRDLLPLCDDGKAPDLAWLEMRERELGVSIQRMLYSERHLLEGRTYEQVMRMAEVALREVAAAYDRTRPDFIYTEDVSCFHSYVHFVIARERRIPFWCVGYGRLPRRLSVYSSGLQHLERVERLYSELLASGLTETQRREADDYIGTFRDRPTRPTGMNVRSVRPGFELGDVGRLRAAAARYLGDPKDPTATSPWGALKQRFVRVARMKAAETMHLFESPVAGEKYVLYPIHFQPEATTLVQAPLYVDQLALLRDIARSLPIGHRLYVKEHSSNRGRRSVEFYNQIRSIPGARLFGPDEDTWSLIRGASAIAVITGTMGWEGLLFDKPVVTFGDVFFNLLPHVYRGKDTPKDGWYDMFRRATTEHRPDGTALRALVVALHQASYPGFMANSTTFPEVLDDANIANITSALVQEAQLGPTRSLESDARPAT